MTQKDLVEKLNYKFPEIEKGDLQFIMNLFFDILKEEIRKGNRIELRDFGVFIPKKTKGIIFKNPRNNRKYYIKSKSRILFKIGKEFKKRLNTPFLASLDLGTQSFRLCLGKNFNGNVYFLAKWKENVRLGEGLGSQRKISSQAFQRGIETLKKFKEELTKYEILKYKAVGTEVFRKAENAKEFVDFVKKNLGIEIEIISPEEEAELSLKGILFGLKDFDLKIENFITIDVGGASSEFIYFNNGKKEWIKSIDLGVVTLKEIFDLRHPLNLKLIKSLKDYIKEKISTLPLVNFQELIITGGTASLLGRLELQLTYYNLETLHGLRINKEGLERLIKKLANFDYERLQKIRGMEKGREDIILGGLLIYSVIFDHFNKESAILNEYGILEGTLLSLIEDYNY